MAFAEHYNFFTVARERAGLIHLRETVIFKCDVASLLGFQSLSDYNVMPIRARRINVCYIAQQW